MSRDLMRHLSSEYRKREEKKKIKLDKYNYEVSRLDNTSFKPIPNMRKELEQVYKSDVTFDQDYEKLTNSNFKYKL